jgi:hypothetical protein
MANLKRHDRKYKSHTCFGHFLELVESHEFKFPGMDLEPGAWNINEMHCHLRGIYISEFCESYRAARREARDALAKGLPPPDYWHSGQDSAETIMVSTRESEGDAESYIMDDAIRFRLED